ncbi:hypothetical protein BH09BAC6_BH09BAC6_35480 [soil metagenome]|jgi:hypothetical protein
MGFIFTSAACNTGGRYMHENAPGARNKPCGNNEGGDSKPGNYNNYKPGKAVQLLPCDTDDTGGHNQPGRV